MDTMETGIINIIRQRLKDIELLRWLSEINNDTRKDAYQGNKMRTYRLFKTIDNRPFRNSTGNWAEFQILTNR